MTNTQKPTALFAESLHPKLKSLFQERGFAVKQMGKAGSAQDLIDNVKGVSVLCVRSRTKISKELLRHAQLDCIGAFCIGVNQIDIKEACLRGAPVFNGPYGNTRSVAEMVLGLMTALSRSLARHVRNMSRGRWEKFHKGCFELRGKSLGIVGYGHIGSQVSVLAEAFGMKVLYYDKDNRLPIGNARPAFSLESLLREADFVSLHVPETPQTDKLIGKKEIALMKKGAFLINTSRGGVVDLEALETALKEGRLQGAALDVFANEPSLRSADFRLPLQDLDNVILTPHIGGSTEEAQTAIAFEVFHAIREFFQTGATGGAVNFPRLSVPPVPQGAVRIANIHENRPGALSQINRLVSESGANIKTQYLATNELTGYLIMDLEKGDLARVERQISALPLSIKTRRISPGPVF